MYSHVLEIPCFWNVVLHQGQGSQGKVTHRRHCQPVTFLLWGDCVHRYPTECPTWYGSIKLSVCLVPLVSSLITELTEIPCELLPDPRSCVFRVPCNPNTPLYTIFKLPSWHYYPIDPPHPSTPPTITSSRSSTTDVRTHPNRRVWMCQAGTMVPCLYYALVGLHGPQTTMPSGVDFHSWSPLLKHIFPSSNIASCPAFCSLLLLTKYTVCSRGHAANTKTQSCELRLFSSDINSPSYVPILALQYTPTAAWLASRFQCTFHPRTGLVTLSSKLLTSGLNFRPCIVLFSTCFYFSDSDLECECIQQPPWAHFYDFFPRTQDKIET